MILNSPQSVQLCTTNYTERLPPPQPTTNNINCTLVSNMVTLHWIPPNPSNCLKTYFINIKPAEAEEEYVIFDAVTESDETSYSLSTTVLKPGLKYIFTVTAIDNGNRKGAASVPIICAVPGEIFIFSYVNLFQPAI